jgi:hypothetical protein
VRSRIDTNRFRSPRNRQARKCGGEVWGVTGSDRYVSVTFRNAMTASVSAENVYLGMRPAWGLERVVREIGAEAMRSVLACVKRRNRPARHVLVRPASSSAHRTPHQAARRSRPRAARADEPAGRAPGLAAAVPARSRTHPPRRHDEEETQRRSPATRKRIWADRLVHSAAPIDTVANRSG